MKQSYKIPESLDANYFDVEIALKTNDGIGIKPVPIKIILSAIISIITCFYFLTNGIISNAYGIQKFLFVVIWIALSVVLLSYDKSKQMKIQLVPVLLNYLPKTNRYLYTRKTVRANEFYHLLGIDKVDEHNGWIGFVDGSYGYMYQVVGSASILLFESDKEAILDRVDSFYRKMGSDYENIYITVKEPQKIHHQLANLKKNYDTMDVRDPDLEMLFNQQFNILKHRVGDECKSIHQYMIIKGNNKEQLTIAKNVLQSEVENSSLMFKQCTAMYHDDIVNVFGPIYKGIERR